MKVLRKVLRKVLKKAFITSTLLMIGVLLFEAVVIGFAVSDNRPEVLFKEAFLAQIIFMLSLWPYILGLYGLAFMFMILVYKRY